MTSNTPQILTPEQYARERSIIGPPRTLGLLEVLCKQLEEIMPDGHLVFEYVTEHHPALNKLGLSGCKYPIENTAYVWNVIQHAPELASIMYENGWPCGVHGFEIHVPKREVGIYMYTGRPSSTSTATNAGWLFSYSRLREKSQ